MNAVQQFYELVATRFTEIEMAKLEHAERLHNLECAYRNCEITQAQYDELKKLWSPAGAGRPEVGLFGLEEME